MTEDRDPLDHFGDPMHSYGSRTSNVTLPARPEPRTDAEPSIRERVLRFLFPTLCLSCQAIVEDPGSSPGLCRTCLSCLRGQQMGGEKRTWPEEAVARGRPGQYCHLCGRTLEAEGLDQPRCGACRRRPPSYDRLFWGWHYGPPLDAVLGGLKFGRLDYLAERLAPLLASEVLPEIHEECPDLDAIVPVPLHWSRRLLRGYDQSLLLARALGEPVDVPILEGLRRKRRTRPQSRLDRRRRRLNPRGAFAVRRRFAADLAGSRLLLVDDVATTGATLDAAAESLKQSGALWVGALTVAFTPHQRSDLSRSRAAP